MDTSGRQPKRCNAPTDLDPHLVSRHGYAPASGVYAGEAPSNAGGAVGTAIFWGAAGMCTAVLDATTHGPSAVADYLSNPERIADPSAQHPKLNVVEENS